MWQIWGKRCLVGLAAVGALGVSMLIIWLLVQYLSYGNRGEEGTRKENVETRGFG